MENNKKTTKINVYKIILLGETNVGKTSIFDRFKKDGFKENQSSSIGVDYETRIMNYNDKKYTILLYDTAGQERFRSITPSYYHLADGFFIVFDLTNENSLNEIKNWIDSIKENSKVTKFIILGNKDDLKDKKMSDDVINDELDKIKQSENNKNIIYLKTSAKKNKNIIEAFHAMIDLIENKNSIPKKEEKEQKKEEEEKEEEEEEQDKKAKANKNIKLNNQQKDKKIKCC